MTTTNLVVAFRWLAYFDAKRGGDELFLFQLE